MKDHQLDLRVVPAFLLLALIHTASAANDTWSGASSTDNNWNTGANWGGAVPANNDNLIFSGGARKNSTNNLSNLIVGAMTFSNGDFTLAGNAFTVSPVTIGAITNVSGINTIANNLTLTPAGKLWSIASGSEVRLSGVMTNTAATGTSSGWMFLTNGGTVRILNTNQSARGMDLFQGTVIVDGGYVDNSNDGIRFKVGAGQTVTTVITNNGTWRIGGGGNFRMGDTLSQSGSLSQMFLDSGTLEVYGTGGGGNVFVSDRAGMRAVFNQNGGLVWGSGGNATTLTLGNAVNADGTYNLNGGILWIGQVRQANSAATNVVFNFNGGTLKPIASSISFFQGLLTANVQNGGAIIDTTNCDITLGQNLLANGTGGLTKLGPGALTLSGSSSYVGLTLVSNGLLNITGTLLGVGGVDVTKGTLSGSGTIAGAVTVRSGATLSPGNPVGALTLQNNLTLFGNLSLEVNKSASTNDFVQVNGILTNSGIGTVLIANLGTSYVAGDSFKFFNRPVLNGGSLVISPATPGLGLIWTNKLALDGSIGVLVASTAGTPADLIDLSVSPGKLTPAFSSNTFNYSVSLAYSNASVTFTPASVFPGATLQIICAETTNAVLSGSASAPISLKVGTNVIDVRVTAPDNSATLDYWVTVTRIPPNVVLILADDQGYSDWGCYGSEIPTPNLDGLASGGLRFRQFYNAARCSPTRCAMLTGLYTQQAGVDPSAALPPLRTDNNITIAELLRANGYRTYMSGKWHLGSGSGQTPEQRGFQEVFTYIGGSDHSEDAWDPSKYRFASTDGETTNLTYAAGAFYQPDVIGDYCLQFLDVHYNNHTNSPFFMYVPFGSAHFPIQAPKAFVDTNTTVYAKGWDAVRGQRYTNMLLQGVIDSRYPLSPRGGTAPWSNLPTETIPAWDTLAADRQADLARRMAIYASMIQKMDQNVGRLVERLRAQGQLENTLIFALSDNGGNFEGGLFGMTGGTANAAPMTGTALANMGQSGQSVIYLGGAWANVSDTPYRLFKHFDHEGGIRTPMIIHWPQGLTRTNQWEEQRGHLIDVMPTIVEITGASYPTQFNGHAVWPMEGKSLKPLFTSNAGAARTLGFEHEGNRAWISGGWKLVTKNFDLLDGSSPANQLELYDLSKDPVEMTNLAALQPTLLAQLATSWNAWAARVGLPLSSSINLAANLPPSLPAPDMNDLFLDTFARTNSTDCDSSALGMTGSRVPPLGANATYYEGWEGSGLPSSIQISSGTLQMAVGLGMAENGIMHNFIGQDIIDAGGFSVELAVQSINTDASDATNRYAGFGVGLSQAEAAAGGDIYSTGTVVFRGSTTGNTGVTDFFIDLDLKGNINVWHNGALLDTVPVGQNYGLLTASYSLSGFSTSDTVTVNVFFNGRQVDINTANTTSVSRTFKWDRNNSNYIGLSARATGYVQMGHLAVRKLPLANALVGDYAMRHGLSGQDSAPGADPDADGVSNFGEWAFGGDPTVPDAFIASLKGTQVDSGNNFRFEYQRLLNYAMMGVQYRYFVSEDLNTWLETSPTVVASTSNEDNTNYEILTLQLPEAVLKGKSKLFLRILAQPVK